jgi:hypothetical protein
MAVLKAHAWSAFLLAINWGVFVWAAQHGRIIDCSLGYFINPLLNVLIGSRLLGERLSRLQKLSIASAACGVRRSSCSWGAFHGSGCCWRLAFALYGLARRRSPLGSLPGLGVETVVGIPIAALYLIWSQQSGIAIWGDGLDARSAAHHRPRHHHDDSAARLRAWSAAASLRAARRAAVSAPTGQFLVGAFVYHETISAAALVSFGLIWTGVRCSAGICICTAGVPPSPPDHAIDLPHQHTARRQRGGHVCVSQRSEQHRPRHAADAQSGAPRHRRTRAGGPPHRIPLPRLGFHHFPLLHFAALMMSC